MCSEPINGVDFVDEEYLYSTPNVYVSNNSTVLLGWEYGEETCQGEVTLKITEDYK